MPRGSVARVPSCLLGIVVTVIAVGGCGLRHGAPEGSPGYVSKANEDCASLFCSDIPGSRTQVQCEPSCLCGEFSYSEPEYDEYHVKALLSWRLLNPATPLAADPYETEALVPRDDEGFCAAIRERRTPGDRSYRLETFPTEAAVKAAGGQITHRGACGACSSFQDLAVYIEQRDLSSAGRNCGLMGTFGPASKEMCFRRLGFTDACAQIWGFNVKNTRDDCFGICSAMIAQENNISTGSLNSCLACDERRSGPIFKAVAGRTRRRSGLSSAIARPCLDVAGNVAVYPVHHYYFETDGEGSGNASASGFSRPGEESGRR